MRSIVTVSPFRCRVWDLHARLEGEINEHTCKAEIESFAKHGQLVPVLGRPVRGNPDWDIELIYGARRLFVARHINAPLQVELREMTDREAIVAMEIENHHRKEVSAYERGMSYARWLRSGHFESQQELARTLKVSAAQVSRLLKLSRLPSVVVDAFGSATAILEGWGLALLSALENDDSRLSILRTARTICAVSPRPPAQDVYRRLLSAAAAGRKARCRGRDQVVAAHDGAPLFRIRQQSSSITLILPLGRVSASHLKDIRQAVAAILQAHEPITIDDASEITAEWPIRDGRRSDPTRSATLA